MGKKFKFSGNYNVWSFFKIHSSFKSTPRNMLILLQYFFSIIFYKLSTKKKNRKPVIGFTNIYYNGNPKAVFEYLQKSNEKYDVFWSAMNLRSFNDVRKNGGKVFFKHGLFGIPIFIKTDIWIVAHDGQDLPFIPHQNYKIVQLWHAVGTKGVNHTKETFKKYDTWCVSSEFSKQKYIDLWNAPAEKLRVTGFAEMDLLYEYLKVQKTTLLREVGIKTEKQTILYAPTFDLGLWPWGDAYKEFEKLCIYCKKNHRILILRLHPYAKIDKKRLAQIIMKYDHVYWLDMENVPDTMKLLAITDILITDWSSIYAYYYLTKRPIIFMDAQREFITKERGGVEFSSEFRAGEIVENNINLYRSLELVLEKGNRFIKEQEKMLNIIFGNVGGKSSERVAKIVSEMDQNNN